jgi:Na+-translocating ferredoxin:NAD+ oxidoreductase RnfD subunit
MKVLIVSFLYVLLSIILISIVNNLYGFETAVIVAFCHIIFNQHRYGGNK